MKKRYREERSAVPDSLSGRVYRQEGSSAVQQPPTQAPAATAQPAVPALDPVRPANFRPTHDLKCWPSFFEQVHSGMKTHEVRKENPEKPFQALDNIDLHEWDPDQQQYTGRHFRGVITYVCSLEDCPGFAEDYRRYRDMNQDKDTMDDKPAPHRWVVLSIRKTTL